MNVDINGKLKPLGLATMRRVSPAAVDSPDVILLGTIKQEAMHTEHPAIPRRHKIDDDLPVLQQPGEPTTSVLAQTEGPIDAVKVTRWNELKTLLKAIPAQERRATKKKIVDEIRTWLQKEGQHRKLFEDLIEVAHPIDDGGPERGSTAYARRNIQQFEVIGPYAGAVHLSNKSLNKELRQAGTINVTTYLWGTSSSERSVSAFGHGNTLSIVNTSKMPGAASTWKENNLSAIFAGKNLVFYVAKRNIDANEELLVSYGDGYNPTLANLHVKQEPVDTANVPTGAPNAS